MCGRLRILLILVAVSLCSPMEAEDRPKRRDSGRSADSYHVLFADGSEVTGKSIDRWDDHKSTSVSGRRLFDPARPAVFLRNITRKPASPGSRVIMANGDIVPGRLIGIEQVEDLPGRPVCLRIMPSIPLRNGRIPRAGIPISPQYVSRIIMGAQSIGRSRPGAVLLQDRSFVFCQAMKWTPAGLRVLTARGARTFEINELADAYLLQTDMIARVLDDALAPCTRRDSLIVSLTTIGGARFTFRSAMARMHEKQLVVQPVWSFNAILLPLGDVCALSVRRHDEAPLSALPGEALAEKAFTGFVWKWRRDRSVCGGPLVSGSLIGDLGIGTHAYSAIAFSMPRGAASFAFHAGLDNRVGTGGCVRLKVCPDKVGSKPLWTSGFLRGGDKPLSVKGLNCCEAKRLVLITEFAHKGRPSGSDPFDIRDEVNWILPTVRLDAAVVAGHYGGAVRYFTGLSGWSLAEPEAAKVQLSAKWDNTDDRWEPSLLAGASGLTLARKIRVTYETVWLYMSAVGRDGNHKISLWIDGKEVKCADGQAHLSTSGDPRSARWSLQPHLGKDVTVMLKVRPGDPRRASPLTRPEVWFTREPVIIPISRNGPVTWRYTTEKPGKNWRELKFDDSSWTVGPALFGDKGEPAARTKWLTSDIWIRRYFKMPDPPAVDLRLTVRHDDGAEVYINGCLAAKIPGAPSDRYRIMPVSPEAHGALKAGRNVIAVHCNDTGGDRFIDVGLTDSMNTSVDDPHVVSRPIRSMPEFRKGMVRVLGKHARISGSRNAKFDSEINALAYWWRGNTWFSWDADIPRNGKYVVQMTYGCISQSAGSRYEIAVGERKVWGVVRATGRWATFTTDDVGEIELDKRGRATITVRLVNTPGKGIMTLHAVTLLPAK